MENIAIIGAGGFGREIQFLLERINKVKPTYNILGYYDDNINVSKTICGYPYLGTLELLSEQENELNLVLGIGVPHVKRKVYNRLSVNKKLKFPTVIDPSAIYSLKHVAMGHGCIICANSIITVNVRLHDFVTVNLSCTIGHDSVIKSFTSLMPTVNISGDVTLEKEVYIGTSATVINQINIGEATIVGAGAVVSKSLPDRCTAVGIPAKPIKFHD